MSVTSEQLKTWATICESISEAYGGKLQTLYEIAAYLRASVPIEVADKLARGCEAGRFYPEFSMLEEADLQAIGRIDHALKEFAAYRAAAHEPSNLTGKDVRG